MAVAFNAVGPGATGAGSAGAATLTWAHTITGSNTVLLAGASLDAADDTGFSMSATYNSLPMTSLLIHHSAGQTAGFLQVWGIVAAAVTANVVVTPAGGTPNGCFGGSLSFTGAAQTVGAAFGTPVAHDGGTTNSTTPTVTLPSSTSGNIVAGFACAGSAFTAATAPATLRIHGVAGGGGAAASDGASSTSPSTGSAVVMSFTSGSDWYAAIAVEVLVPTAGVTRTEQQSMVPQAVKRASLW